MYSVTYCLNDLSYAYVTHWVKAQSEVHFSKIIISLRCIYSINLGVHMCAFGSLNDALLFLRIIIQAIFGITGCQVVAQSNCQSNPNSLVEN